jgi:transcriptional regulator with XRE-family HTH domain
MNAIGERLRELRRASGKNQTEFAAIAGVSRNAQVNYEAGKRSPDSDYMAALQAAGYDVQYVLTGYRTSDVPGAREFMDRMEEAAAKTRALWRVYPLPEDPGLFAAMQGVRAIPGATDGHTDALAQAMSSLLTQPATQGVRDEPDVARYVQGLDEALLRSVMLGVEDFLAAKRARMPIDKKAELIAGVYAHFLQEKQTKASRANVLAFIRRGA